MKSTGFAITSANEQTPLKNEEFIQPSEKLNFARMKYLPNFLIVRGTGRNVGKTLSACNIISNLAGCHEPVGVKISPHFHELDGYSQFIHRSKAFVIVEEKKISQKDSSRMLQAGAKRVFYMQARNEQLLDAFGLLIKVINPGSPVIVESGGLYDIVEPALLVNVVGENSGKKISVREQSKALFLPSDKVPFFNWDALQFINGKFTLHA